MSTPAAHRWPEQPAAREAAPTPVRPVRRRPAPVPPVPRQRAHPHSTPTGGGSGSGGGGRGPGPGGVLTSGGRPPRLDDVDPRPGVIRGLDGLRAIAVLAVLGYHLAPGALPGGFIGVDVFFVVSGFLITTLLLREVVGRGGIDLRGFWVRRARRLVPALVVVVVVSVLAARLAGGDLLVGIVRQSVGALTFSNNWLEIAAGSSYAHSTAPQLFVNFWSLAVEEQFYLVWPFALTALLALAGTTRARVALVAGVGLASALLMALLVTPGEDPTRVYYGTDTHLFGLAAGIVLALLWATPRRAGLRSAPWRRARPLAVGVALLTLVGSMVVLSMSTLATFRGGLLLATLATVVLIAALLESGSRWRTFLQSPPLTWVGQRSYGLYLWHWPVIVVVSELVPFAPGTPRGVGVLALAVVVSFTLTALSYRFVELPVRRLGFRGTARRVRAFVRTPWAQSRAPSLIAGGVTFLLIASVAAALSAPSISTTQAQIERTEAELATDGAFAGPDAAVPAPEGSALLPDWVSPRPDDAGGAARPEAERPPVETPSQGPAEPGVPNELAEPAEPGEDVSAPVSPTTEGLDLSMPEGEEITAIGDSLVVTSADGLEHAFPGITLVAKSNRQWDDAQPTLEQALADDEVRRAVVVHFGTNAGVDEAALRELLDTLGPERMVVVMTLYVRADFQDPSNETIREVVAEYPNAIVGDWHAAAAAAPEMLQSDQVHPDLEGMHLYADVVRAAFEQLGQRGAGS